MHSMTNADVARVFAEVADLLEIKGEDAFRINSYRRVARTLEDLAGDIEEIAARGELEQLPGVGKGSAQKIGELLRTGKLALRVALAAEIPETLLRLLDIPGLGPKKIALLWRQLGIDTLDALQQALLEERLAGMKGFGARGIDQIRRGLEFLTRSAGRTRLGVAWAVAEQIRSAVLQFPGVQRVVHAGSLRRGRETVGDLDLVCAAADGAAVVRQFTELPTVSQVLAAGETKGSVLIEYRPGRTLQVDLRVVPEGSFGAAWQYFTGSKEHNVRLRERAVKRGWSLNEYGLTEGDRVIASRTEEEIYAALEVPCVPPELREDRGELELSEAPADLLSVDDIRGDLHVHTTASDGHCAIEQMAAAAIERGYKFLCITDHSGSSTIANGLDEKRMRKQIRDVRRVAEKTPKLTLWVGAEVDILNDGRLDYPDELLAELDFVVASIHFGMGQDQAANTQRTLAAIRNPYVNVIGHPTGRLLGKRDAMPLDIEAVAAEAARTGTALEINASNYRLDLKDQHCRLARDAGAVISINTDAHDTAQLDEMRFGVLTARRGWLRKQDVLNTWTARKIQSFVAAKRRAVHRA